MSRAAVVSARRCPTCEVELPADGHRFVRVFGIAVLTCPTVPMGEVVAVADA